MTPNRDRLSLLAVLTLAAVAVAGPVVAVVWQEKDDLPKDEEGLWSYATGKQNYQQWKDADRAFKRLIELFPKSDKVETAYYQLGYLHLYYSQKYAESRQNFETLCEKFPKGTYYWQARFAVGQTYQYQNLRDKAIEVYEKIAKDAPDENYRTSAIQQVWGLKGKQFYMYVSQSFTAGEKPAVEVSLCNVDKVDYRVVRIKYDRLLEGLKGDEPDLHAIIDKVGKDAREELKKWTENHNVGAQRWEQKKIEIPSAESGIYIVEGTHDRITMSVTVFVARYGIITKAAGGKLLVFAQDRATSKPVPGMTIKILSKESPITGTTDEQGLFVTEMYKGGTVLGMKDHEAVPTQMWYSSANQTHPVVYIQTDRPIYRPNQKVFFKIVHRQESGKKLEMTPGAKVVVTIRDPKNNVVYNEKHQLNEFGTTHGQMMLGDEPPLGLYSITMRPEKLDPNKGDDNEYYWMYGYYGTNNGQFRVDAYRKPEYKVDVEFKKGSVLQGETIVGIVNAQYYFGSPVADAEVTYKVMRRWHWWYWCCWDWYYDWYMEDEEDESMPWRNGGYDEQVFQATGRTDKDGKMIVRYQVPKTEHDAVYTIVAQVTDLSRRTVDGAGGIKATRAEFGMAMTLNKYVYKPGDKVNAKIRATTADDKPVANRKITVRAYNEEWNHHDKYNETQIYKGETRTDAQGIAELDFSPDVKGGYLKLVAEAVDDKENKVTAEHWLWLYSDSWYGDVCNFNGLDLVLDKKTYDMGDTARIMITSQYKNISVLLTIEGKEVYHYEVVTIKGHTKVVDLKIDNKDFAPNMYVSVTAIKENAISQKYKAVIVNPSEKFVNIKITPDKSEYRPREKAKYVVQTTGADGKPVSVEVALGIVDESIYALQAEFGQDIRKHFIHKRWYEVQTNSSLYYWESGRAKPAEDSAKTGAGFALEESKGQSKKDNKSRDRGLTDIDHNESADSGGYAATEVRSLFADTMHWVADVVTDADGRAVIEVAIPDNLTTWRATARAVSKDGRFGQEKSSVIARKDVIVRLELPRFFTQNDETVLTAVAHNYLKTEKKMKIVLEVEGLAVEGQKEQEVVVEAGGQKRFDWKVNVRAAGAAKVTVKALTNEASDAMQLIVPILAHGSLKWDSKTGFVEGKVTEKIALPKEAIAQASELTIVVSPTHASTVLDALDYLAGYPYGCVEQTMSRFLPTVIVGQTLQKLGISKPELQKELPAMVSAGLQRLYNFQHQDGGWGWWQNDKSNPYITAYVMYGLSLARSADFAVDENVYNRGLTALRAHMAEKPDENTQAYILSALSAAGQKDDTSRTRLTNDLKSLNSYSKALLAMVLHKDGKEEAKRVLGMLSEEAASSGAVAYWKGNDGHYGWMDHYMEVTAVALKAFVAIDPKNPLVPKIVNWLSSVRQGNYWASTKQTAMVVMAMSDYLALTGELNPDMTISLSLNGDRVFSERVTKENWQKFNGTRTFKATQLNAGTNEITIDREGTGTPIYSIYLRYYAVTETFEASKGDITLDRAYSKVVWDGQKRVLEPLKEGETVTSDDEIEVSVKLHADKNYEWLMVECPLPAGFEAQHEYYGHYGWYWNYWYSAKEFRDDRVCVAVQTLWWNHDNVITYTMRAETPGDFRILPATAWNMYHPQIGGNSAGFRLKVKDKEGAGK